MAVMTKHVAGDVADGHRPDRPCESLESVLGAGPARAAGRGTGSKDWVDPRVPARGAQGLGRRPDAGRAGQARRRWSRSTPTGFFEAVFPDRAEPVPVPAHGREPRGACLGVRRPLQFGPGPHRLRPPPAGRGDALPQLRAAGRPPPRPTRGSGASTSPSGPRTPSASAWSATSTTGTAAATRCGTAARPASGRSSSPTSARARSTSSRSRAGTTATSSRSPTPTASPPSSGPRPPRSSGTSPSSPGTTRTGWRSRAERQALDSPIAIYEVHLGSWKRKAEEGNRLPQLPRAGRRAGRAPRAHALHPHRADADHRAPVRRELGLSAGRLLRPDVAARHARRLRLLRRHAAPARLSA